MFLKHFLFTVLLFSIIACNNASDSNNAATTGPAVSAPSTPVPAATSAPAQTRANDSDFNENTVDDAAAERIKNYLVNSFLQRDVPLMQDVDKQFQLYRIDLNKDGSDEYFVRFVSDYFCGNKGCMMLLLNNNLTLINLFKIMPVPIFVSSVAENGWAGILVKDGSDFKQLIYAGDKYPETIAALPKSKRSPGGLDAILFDDDSPSKTYFFSEKPIQQIQKGVAQHKRLSVFQRTYNAGSFAFKVNATNGETTPIHISTEGLPRVYKETFEIEGAVREGHLLDLNKDGFKELYLITQPTDDSGNLDIMGFASFRDKSAGAIIVKDTKEVRQVNTDRVFVENGELRRSFLQDGKTMSFKYKLEKGETGFVLRAVQF